jgi:Abortive infection alpha
MAKKSKRAKRARAKRAKAATPGRGKLSQRALGPAADEFGKKLAPLGKELGEVSLKVGQMLLRPIKGLVGGLESIGAWLGAAITKRLSKVPEGKIVAPSPRIAVPAVQALVYSMEDEFIREMFANLLAADMDVDRKDGVHPAFVELIKEMTSEDARVLTAVIERSHVRFRIGAQTETWQLLETAYSIEVEGLDWLAIGTSVTNLVRMGLIELREFESPHHEKFTARERSLSVPYEEMLQGERSIPEDLEALLPRNAKVTVNRTGIYRTDFGVAFWNVVMN